MYVFIYICILLSLTKTYELGHIICMIQKRKLRFREVESTCKATQLVSNRTRTGTDIHRLSSLPLSNTKALGNSAVINQISLLSNSHRTFLELTHIWIHISSLEMIHIWILLLPFADTLCYNRLWWRSNFQAVNTTGVWTKTGRRNL